MKAEYPKAETKIKKYHYSHRGRRLTESCKFKDCMIGSGACQGCEYCVDYGSVWVKCKKLNPKP